MDSYNIAAETLLKTYAGGAAPEGHEVISGGRFNGDVVVNGNFCNRRPLGSSRSSFALVAKGRTRGDFVSPDLDNARTRKFATCEACPNASTVANAPHTRALQLGTTRNHQFFSASRFNRLQPLERG